METQDNQVTNGEITVSYEPRKCIHAEKCCNGLASVFRSTVLPWINLDAAQTSEIIAQIGKCPSGALSYEMKKELANTG